MGDIIIVDEEFEGVAERIKVQSEETEEALKRQYKIQYFLMLK